MRFHVQVSKGATVHQFIAATPDEAQGWIRAIAHIVDQGGAALWMTDLDG